MQCVDFFKFNMGSCLVRPWLIEFNGDALSCFAHSRMTIFPAVPLINPEDSLNPLFKAVLDSVSVMGQETCE